MRPEDKEEKENTPKTRRSGRADGRKEKRALSPRERERRRRLRKKRRMIRLAILAGMALAAVLLVAGIVWGVMKLTSGEGTEQEKTAKDITISEGTVSSDRNAGGGSEKNGSGENGSDEKQGNSVSKDDPDNRRVKNTATEEHHKTNGLAICMYHYVYDKADPPDDLNNNYIEVSALEEEVKYLVDNEYYFPTWEEVRQYVEGELLLPEKSVVLTFDDGAKSFLELGIPVLEKYEVPATSFLITGKDGEAKVKEYQSDYVTFQSHSDNMHRGGGNIGHGGIFTAMSHDDAVADLKKSVDICGHGDAFAYPYGDYTDDCKAAVADAGFTCAVTTENRRAEVGDDPLLLPRVRMLEGQSLEGFISLVE